MKDNTMFILKRPKISLKDIAMRLNTSVATVDSSINFHNNSPLARQIRQVYVDQLREELNFIEQAEKFFSK